MVDALLLNARLGGAEGAEDLGSADEALLHKVLAVVQHIAERVTREHGACRVLTNLGRYQDSKHLHFHVNSGDPLR